MRDSGTHITSGSAPAGAYARAYDRTWRFS